tara:strand:+ start:4418 stop:5539 length:1122 start_codon:yes stop_codon:yes gene_type:complete
MHAVSTTAANTSSAKGPDGRTIVTHVQRLAPSSSEITSTVEKDYFWQVILNYWRLPSHIHHFPGANPMSIEKKDFTRLSADDFLAALKTDGVRHLLLMTTKPNSNDPITIMVDRAKRMYEIEVWANEDFFQTGSLYDSELVWEQDSLVLIVFDVILAKGVPCTHLSYRERMQILHNTILCVSESHSDESVENMISEECKFLARNNDHNLHIIPKKCVSKASLRSLWSDRLQSKHRNDGIVFTLNSASVDTGTSTSILKWKPSHSIDVRFELNGNAWLMYANMNNSSGFVRVEEACRDFTVEVAPSKLLDAIRTRQPCIVECIINISNETLILVPERERTDKTAPNTVKTVEATIRNARENISSDDLIEIVNST